jgi:hypothetical protein
MGTCAGGCVQRAGSVAHIETFVSRGCAHGSVGQAHVPLTRSVDRLVGLGDRSMSPSFKVVNNIPIIIRLYSKHTLRCCGGCANTHYLKK